MSDSQKGVPENEETVIRRREDFLKSAANLADRVMGRGEDAGAEGKDAAKPGAPGQNPGPGSQNQPKSGPVAQQKPGPEKPAPQQSGPQQSGPQQSGPQPGPQQPAGNPNQPKSGPDKPGPGNQPKPTGNQGAAGGAAPGSAASRPGQQQTHGGGPVRTGEAARGVPAPTKTAETKPVDAQRANAGSGAQKPGTQGSETSSPTQQKEREPRPEGKSGRMAAREGLAAAAGVAAGRADGVAAGRADGRAPGRAEGQAKNVGRSRRSRKARLRVAVVDPWPVMKTAFLFSIAGAIIVVVATAVLWGVLEASGLFEQVNKIVGPFLDSPGGTRFDINQFVTFRRVLGASIVLSAINVALITALATLGAFLYNLAAAVNGGLEVTLAEE